MAGPGRGGPASRPRGRDEYRRIRKLAAPRHAPAAMSCLRRGSAAPPGPAAGSAVPAGKSQDPSQQRRGAQRGPGSDPGEIPPPCQPGERGRDLAQAHDRRDRPLAACLLGRRQSRHEKPEPEFAPAKPAQQERRQGQHEGAIRGQRSLRGDRALLGRPCRRRDPPPQALHRLRHGRRRSPSERCAAVQRQSAGQCGTH